MESEDKAWIEYRKKFSERYDESNYSSPLQSLVMRASHKLVEKAYTKDSYFKRVLEIGAGTGEHVYFVHHQFDEYTLSDLDNNTLEVAKKKIASTQNSSFKFECQSGEELSYDDDSFDRLIATHVLEHIYQPHLALKEWIRVIKNGGVLSILIPTDPGLAWRLGKNLGPRRNAMAQGIAYDYVMAREHVNSCHNLIAILRHYFPDAKESWWPFPVPSIDMNLFFSFHAIVQKKETFE
ncbi:class I SAM-dependent methyltransferase [Pseudomonas rustica]|uniref:class I SAM-dependent methyltransferase n=1 Tax=Pseudomonas rustica TaxID=2827099 RepID=UPI003CF36FD1